jgi:hypothetical protein
MDAGWRYSEKGRRVGAPDLARDRARRAIEESAPELRKDFGVRPVDLSTHHANTLSASRFKEVVANYLHNLIGKDFA